MGIRSLGHLRESLLASAFIVFLLSSSPAAFPAGSRAASPQLVVQAGHTDFVKCAVISPDGKLIATGGGDSAIRLWDASSGRMIATLDGHAAGVLALSFTPDGGRLVSGSMDGAVKIWSLAERRAVRDVGPCRGGVFAVSFIGPTRVAGYDNTGTLTIWDAASGSVQKALRGYAQSGPNCAFSSDGRLAALRSAAGSVEIVEIETGRKRVVPEIDAPFAFADAGSLFVAAAGKDAIKVIDAGTGKILNTLPHAGGALRLLAVSPKARLIASADRKSILRLIDLATGRVLRSFEEPEYLVLSLCFGPDGSTLATGHMGGIACLWDVSSGIKLKTLEGSSMIVNAVAFSGDGRYLASAGWESSIVKLWDLRGGTGIRNLSGHNREIHGLAFSREGKYVISGSADDSARVWSPTRRTALAVLEGHSDGARAVAFSPDGDTAATGDGTGVVRLWKWKTGELLLSFQAHRHPVNAIAFGPDCARLAAAGTDGTVSLWDWRTGKVLRRFTDGDQVNTAAFSPDGKQIASGGWNNRIMVRDAETGAVLRVLEGHSAWVESAAFSPDGKYIISASRDHTARLWDLETGAAIRTFRGHTDGVFSVAFGPHGDLIASGSWDTSLKLWKPDGTELCTLITFDRKDAMFSRAVGWRYLIAAGPHRLDVRTSQTRPETDLPGHNDWLVVTPEGFFDGSAGGMKKILWRFSDSLFDIAEPEQYFNEFYQPGLLKDIVERKRTIPEILKAEGDTRATLTIAEKDRRLPRIEIEAPQSAKTRTIDVTLRLWQAPPKGAHKSPSGIRDVRLFNNGTLAFSWPGPRGEKTLTGTVPVIAGTNIITAYCFNDDNIKSRDTVTVTVGRESLSQPAEAFVLAIGIDTYAEEKYNLRFAAADAKALSSALGENLPVPPGRMHISMLLNEHATQEGIRKALRDLAKSAEPEDIVIISYAGHGVSFKERFYLIPHDMIISADEQSLALGGISDRDLEDLFLPFRSQSMLLILDACFSGRALESEERRQGPMNSRGFAQLAWEKGLAVLTASQSHQAAVEINKLGHGLLTYALLRGFAEAPRDGTVLRSDEWLNYAADLVPRVLEEDEDLRNRMVALRGGGSPFLIPVQNPRLFVRRDAGGGWSVAGPRAP